MRVRVAHLTCRTVSSQPLPMEDKKERKKVGCFLFVLQLEEIREQQYSLDYQKQAYDPLEKVWKHYDQYSKDDAGYGKDRLGYCYPYLFQSFFDYFAHGNPFRCNILDYVHLGDLKDLPCERVVAD